jgi:hypothetical protein
MDGVHEVGVPHARALLAFADAAVPFDPVALRPARAAVLAAEQSAEWRGPLGIDRYASLKS